MSDNDFDKLFKDKFEDAAVEPSADLWAKIAPQIQPQRKRTLPLLWMAAASVALVASVMLWSTQEEKIQLQSAQVEVAPVTSVQQPSTSVTPEVEVMMVVNGPAEGTRKSPKEATHTTNVSFASATVTDKVVAQKNNVLAVQPIDGNEHLTNNKANVEPMIAAGFSRDVESEIMYAQANVADDNNDNSGFNEASNENRKSLRNVGDLINFVVDKVDRRDRKIVKFNTDDDDNSSIIGLNVGFIKLNKRDR